MNEVKFYLLKQKKNTSKTKTPVVLAFNYSGNRLYCQVGLRVTEDEFDPKRQRIKSRVAGSLEMNIFLDRLAKEVQDIYLKGMADGATITNEYILSRLSIKKKNKEQSTNRFFDEWENFLSVKSNQYAVGTLKSARTSLNHFKEFCNRSHLSPTFDDISLALLNDFRNYLLKIGQLNNTVFVTVKRMRFFLNWAYRNGKTTNIIFREFRLKEYEGNVHYLTWDEVMKIFHFEDLSAHEKQVRDFFSFCACTGLRFSDGLQIRRSDCKEIIIDGQVAHFAEIREKKTGALNTIPLMEPAIEILNRYKHLPGDRALPTLNMQVMNRYLKEIARRAGINDTISIDKFRGNKNERVVLPKHRKIGSHWARRSFVSHLLRLKVLPTTIMSITGHKDFKSFRRYYSVQPDDKFNQMKECFPDKKEDGQKQLEQGGKQSESLTALQEELNRLKLENEHLRANLGIPVVD